jgi:NLI interacting factor-like phosphatase
MPCWTRARHISFQGKLHLEYSPSYNVEHKNCKLPFFSPFFSVLSRLNILLHLPMYQFLSTFQRVFIANCHFSGQFLQRPASIKKKSLSSTNSKGSQQKCSDCVGDAILRLLGISPKPSPPPSSSTGASRMNSNHSSKVLSDDDMRSTTSAATSEMDTYCSSKVLSSAFSPMTASTSSSSSYSDDAMGQGASQPDSRQIQSPQRGGNDSVYMKLQRLASRTEILFINEPRRNTKLLVLDLDHTLMDFSCRFDYMVEELKRPYLDDFLAQSYLYYDIAVWSQTNFKWLELKLTELGMLNRNDYKICFALVLTTPPHITSHHITMACLCVHHITLLTTP